MAELRQMGQRRFGRMNWLGLMTLAEREIRRFLNVWSQTLLAPLITAGLLLLVFHLAIGPRRGEVMGVPYIIFIAPGLMMMTVIQNAFANASSSILSAKVQGNIVDTLMPPLSPFELVAGYALGAVARGAFVAVVMALGIVVFFGQGITHPLWLVGFVIAGGAFMGGLGICASLFAAKFDQLSAITNFIITPLAFLSGTFYSVQDMPPVMQLLSHINPFFYIIDGGRFAVIGQSDSSPVLGLAIVVASALAVLGLCWRWFKTGYRMKP
ncbi:ABC transporter permease [Algirhabdus cladophorae]|uniref:ABC transporter permease n=1 Tax=Algirhabdus cladophorae TaxID=3377108 RepID=UPI003B84559D